MPAAISPTPRQPDSHIRKISSVGSRPRSRSAVRSGERSRVPSFPGRPRSEPASRTPLQKQNPRAATSDARRDAPNTHAAYQTVLGIGMIRSMAQGLRELVGRVMIDPEFLAELQRAPEPLLAQYELSDSERAIVELALARLAQTPVSERRRQFSNTLISRVAT